MSEHAHTFVADGEIRTIVDWFGRAIEAQCRARIDGVHGPFGGQLDDFAALSAAGYLLQALVDGDRKHARYLFRMYGPGGAREQVLARLGLLGGARS